MFKISSTRFNLLFALFMSLSNYIYFDKFYQVVGFSGIFLANLIIIPLLLWAGTTLLFWKKSSKILAALFIIINTFSLYFMITYSISIDKIMLLNVLETDVAETKDLLSLRLFVFVLIGAGIPLWIMHKTEIIYSKFAKELLQKSIIILCSLSLICLIMVPNLKTTAQFLRNNRHLKYDLLPINYIGAVISATKIIKKRNHPLVEVGTDAKLANLPTNGKKNLIVLVVGETARAQNFSLGSYHRPTNKFLDKYKKDIYYFEDTSSCGTATAVSIPCMFSAKPRTSFKTQEGAYTENALDVIKRAGYSVLWRENNSGCKDVCKRVETEDFCKDDNCRDDILLKDFSNKVKSYNNNTLVVLHQQGSHGPAYFKRYPKELELFKPACNTSRLDKCSQQEIINSYDNSIAYSSFELARNIEELQKLQNIYNIVLIYISDHGESLGENDLYLHSAPYAFAPKEQTKVPFFIWLSEQNAKNFGINRQCLINKLSAPTSHDNLFHTLLGMSGVTTSVYNPKLDLLNSCRP